MPNLLIIGGGLDGAAVAKRAEEMGVTPYVADRDVNCPASAYATVIGADCYDTDAIVDGLGTLRDRLDGAIAVGVDNPCVASKVCGKPSLDVAARCTNKALMYQRLLDLAPPARVGTGRVVTKPIVGHGTQGVSIVDLRDKVVQEYLDGPQYSAEGVVLDGKVYVCGWARRTYAHDALLVELGGEMDDPDRRGTEVIEKGLRRLGLDNWVWKADLVEHDGAFFIIEMAARVSGGLFGTHCIPMARGIDYPGIVVKVALGMDIDPEELRPKFYKELVTRWTDWPCDVSKYEAKSGKSFVFMLGREE